MRITSGKPCLIFSSLCLFLICNATVTVSRYRWYMETNRLVLDSATSSTPLDGLVQRALQQVATSAFFGEQIRIHTVFDRDTHHYLLVAEGWEGYRRVHRTLAHIALTDDAVHIYEDGTIVGIKEQLLSCGVPVDRIVCEWIQLPAARVTANDGNE